MTNQQGMKPDRLAEISQSFERQKDNFLHCLMKIKDVRELLEEVYALRAEKEMKRDPARMATKPN